MITLDQWLILGILCITTAMFIWGQWRHDMVALASLLMCVVAGVVPSADAFAGFGHPAVITVACVLILSGGLQATGAADLIIRRVLPATSSPVLAIISLSSLAALLSAFMNNVGALALLMPAAMQIAVRVGLPPGQLLMPLAFGSILGGMTTLIGTPPNLIVANYSHQKGAGGFAMFDFTPVGLAVAVAGILLIALGGWRLVPARKRSGVEGFDTAAYLTEARIVEKSKAVGMTLREIEESLEGSEAQFIGLIRGEIRLSSPRPYQKTRAGDILVIEAEPEALTSAIAALGLVLEESLKREKAETAAETLADVKTSEEMKEAAEEISTPASNELALMELAVLPDSALVGRSVSDIRMRSHYGISLLALSRQGNRSMARLRTRKSAQAT